tara:strand:+ start:60 stop:650 length:591 start_codon:yes stop_codon:yes gene_type:complete
MGSNMTKPGHIPMLPQADKIGWSASVNGKSVSKSVESNAILLDVLRDYVGTLGVKRGCDMGTCGCCAVLINGEPRLSCLTLAQEVNDTDITTVEGLADGTHLAPIQETFAIYGGSQCGFCTPGFLVVAEALLRSNQNPTKDEIKTAIEGNLCRCTGYQPIVDSILAASEILSSNEGTIDSTQHQSDPHPGFIEEDN